MHLGAEGPEPGQAVRPTSRCPTMVGRTVSPDPILVVVPVGSMPWIADLSARTWISASVASAGGNSATKLPITATPNEPVL